MITQRAPGWEMRTTQRCEFGAQCLQLICSISPQTAAQQRKWHWHCWTTCSIGRSRPCQTSLAKANMARSSWTHSWSMAFAVSPPELTVDPSSINKRSNFSLQFVINSLQSEGRANIIPVPSLFRKSSVTQKEFLYNSCWPWWTTWKWIQHIFLSNVSDSVIT